ncbi:MAG: 50S ribosomal protein L25 [Sphingomonadales bacterium]
MADVTKLEVAVRERSGKGSARADRRAGLVPAVIYGDKKPTAMVTIRKNELIKLFNRGGFMTQLFELKIGDKAQKVLPRDLQLHPVSDEPLHVDFLRLSAGAKVVIEIPVVFLDEEEAEGLARGPGGTRST